MISTCVDTARSGQEQAGDFRLSCYVRRLFGLQAKKAGGTEGHEARA